MAAIPSPRSPMTASGRIGRRPARNGWRSRYRNDWIRASWGEKVKPGVRTGKKRVTDELSDHPPYDAAAVLHLLPFALISSEVDLQTHLHAVAEQLRSTLAADAVLIQMRRVRGAARRLRRTGDGRSVRP